METIKGVEWIRGVGSCMRSEESGPERIRRVVIPVDTSDISRVAAEQGAYFAKLLDAEVSIVSVNDTQQFMLSTALEEQIQHKTQTILDDVCSIAKNHGVDSKTVMLEGNPAQEIVISGRGVQHS